MWADEWRFPVQLLQGVIDSRMHYVQIQYLTRNDDGQEQWVYK